MYWFTADEHYGHANIIKYCNRPFQNVSKMNSDIIHRSNSVIAAGDIVIHAGDFCWKDPIKYIAKLKGQHLFLRGSHDKWLHQSAKYIWRKRIENQLIVVCHYAMRTWEASHYNSWQLFGHSHGRLNLDSKQHDIGVDNNNFFPVSFNQIKTIMRSKPNNPNFIEKGTKT